MITNFTQCSSVYKAKAYQDVTLLAKSYNLGNSLVVREYIFAETEGSRAINKQGKQISDVFISGLQNQEENMINPDG